MIMENKLYTKSEVINFINQGKVMLLSGSEKAISGLPNGKWIAGTTPYFMDGVGVQDEEKIFVDDFTDYAQNVKIKMLDSNNIQTIATEAFGNGFVVIVLPIESDVYYTFSANSLNFDGIFDNPVVGYVSCCNINMISNPKTFVASGLDGKVVNDKAAVLYVELPDSMTARTEIMNFDTIDETTPVVVFPKTSFVQSDCLIDGKPGNISDYLENVVKPKIGGYTQFITSMNGALINRDPKVVNTETGETSFYSPVYKDDKYQLVKPGKDYAKAFNDNLNAKTAPVVAAFSCISYFFGGNFIGKHISKNGVYAFGEIAYQLLNKTIVTLEIEKA